MLRRWFLMLVLACTACSKDNLVADPFTRAGRGADAGTSVDPSSSGADAGAASAPQSKGDPTTAYGGPCIDDAECSDGIDCTTDVCDPTLGLCRFTANDSLCDDGVFCNGIERCNPRLGCRPGPPKSCSDSTPCTIDTCDEATRSCVQKPRDVDGDGDVDANCDPGHDCNDLDPTVSSLAREICGNGIDDNCNGDVDEADCDVPRYDTCADALTIAGPGSYLAPPGGTHLDYGASCAASAAALTDLVLSVQVPAGPPQDVDIVARSALGQLTLARSEVCGSGPELECVPGARLPSGSSVGRLRLRSAAPGVYPLYLLTDANTPIQLEVSLSPATRAPTNVDCASALPLTAGTEVVADLALGGTPLQGACETNREDLVYQVTLAAPADVRVFADSIDDLGLPRLSLQSGDCATTATELSCDEETSATLHHHSLPAGTYRVAVSATGPSQIGMRLALQPPTPAPDTDQCSTAPELTPNLTEDTSFIDLLDDIAAACSAGYVDAAYSLDLANASDVLLVANFSSNDAGSVGLVNAACGENDVRGCSRRGSTIGRVGAQALAAGSYRALLESALGLPATIIAAVRPARPVTLVPAADACPDVLTIDAGGGLFQGSTLNADNDFSASCDFATANGSPDQLLRLVLDQPRRVILDMTGSNFDTLLNVRQGPGCPGDEVLGGCSAGVGGDQSFLDLELAAGEYFLQIDGYAGAQGAWSLNVFTLDP
jgi:hypothetical protein